jgi:hypothetical protein
MPVMRMIFLSPLLCLVAVSCAAQECTAYVVVNAWEPRIHMPIETLKAGDLAASFDKGHAPLTVVSASQQYKSRLLVLLETDGLGKGKIDDAVDTVTRFARQAPEGQPLAFGVYADHAVFTKGFFSNSSERAAAVSAVREAAGSLGKRVALYDSLLEAVKLFGEHQPGDAILLVGSPYDDRSSKSVGAVEKALMESGVRLLVMLRESMSSLNRDDFLINSHEAEKKLFSDLSLRTGGAYTDFDAGFLNFAWRGYMLAVKQPDGAGKTPRKWKLKLQGQAADNLKRARIYFPELLPPCGSPPPG